MIFPTILVGKDTTAADRSQRGFSLVELMIAITIGMLVVAALLALFLNITRNNRELAKANTQIENGRFAIQLLQNDLVHAGFWGELRPAAPTAIPDPCLAVGSWDAAYKANMLGVPVMGFSDSTFPSTCTTVSSPQTNSDVLVVRHANTCTWNSAGCDGGADEGPHIQVSNCTASNPPEVAYVVEADSAEFTLTNNNCTTVAPRRKVVSNIYYVSDDVLMRSSFTDGAYQAAQPLIEGIEALRFEYGIDADGDGSPDNYLSAPPTTLVQLANIVAVKVHVLARNLEATPGYTHNKTYQLGNTTVITPANDGFKRHVFSTTVRLVNPSGRREVP
jgi:type IV pilus assembly protein PilW